ncbi:transmembrane [Brachionus plicatilis]|uniref:Transmembrane (Macronuclear) n=1 Tax=Brachionus plicatilis TaxID=10195 RepID=A0A3M7RU71_BRAPC|nr:transmembrane [Brachionus plicatilis]
MYILINFIFIILLQSVWSLNIQCEILKKLSDHINSFQVLQEQPYKPAFKWHEKQGLYRSDIRVNFFGSPAARKLRNGELTSVFDNDMFSTAWIITTILESNLYGKGAPLLDQKRLQLALEAIGSFRDKNDKNYLKSLIRSFWPQIYNSTFDIWQQQPDNIRNVALSVEYVPWDRIIKLLSDLKLEQYIKYVEELRKREVEILDAFSIPPDFDDSYLNLGLGAALFRLKSKYPFAYQSWKQNNTDTQNLIKLTKKYSYRPFSADLNENSIDPRTYFYARGFIQQAYRENKSVSLISTWIQNLDEQRKLKQKCVSMPFNVNNVDVTVAANSIYGITSGAIFNVNDFREYFLKNQELVPIYLNTSFFISWTISNNFTARPDLAQVYYPSTYNFLWYASRTLFLIESELKKFYYFNKIGKYEEYFLDFEKLENILIEAKHFLQDTFETAVTRFLVNSSIQDGRNKTFFRDFIGLNDTNIFGKQESKNDDSLFSTAQAVNILIATWTYQCPKTQSLKWKPNAGNGVKFLVKKSVNWLHRNVLCGKFKPLNSFFSGSVKGFSTLPFWYPGNLVQFLNGTNVDPSKIDERQINDVIYAVKGFINEKEYQNMLAQKHFGFDTPLDFHGYNTKENIFPFWSSAPYTYAVSLLALSQYQNLEK